MATAKVDGLTLGYEVIGEGGGRPWSITPGGRFTKESPGVRQLAEALAAQGNRVLIWDRPNCGESDVCFEGSSESAMQADALAGLLRHLDMTPAVISGGSGGARVSLLAASRHPEAAAGVAVWWISGGVYGLLTLATHYCGGSLGAAWTRGHGGGGRVARMGRGHGAEPLATASGSSTRTLPSSSPPWSAGCWPTAPRRRARARPARRRRPRAWTCPPSCSAAARATPHHTRATSEALAWLLPRARLVEPPWGDREWIERQEARDEGLFARWPLLAPQLLEWQADTWVEAEAGAGSVSWAGSGSAGLPPGGFVGGGQARCVLLWRLRESERTHEEERQLVDGLVEVAVDHPCTNHISGKR